MADLFSIIKKIRFFRRRRYGGSLGGSVPPPVSLSPTPTISSTPSVTPTITPSVTVTPSFTPTVTITPTPSVTPNNYYLAVAYNCLRFSNTCNQYTGQTTLQGDGTLTIGSFYTSSLNPSYVFQILAPTNISTVEIILPVLSSEMFNDCLSACIAINPTPSPTSTPSITPTKTPSVTPSRTPSVTPTRTPSISVTPTRTPSATVSPTPSISTYIFSYNLQYSNVDSTTACSSGTPVTRYSDSALNIGYKLTTDAALTINAPAGYYCVNSGACSNNRIWIYFNGTFISQIFVC